MADDPDAGPRMPEAAPLIRGSYTVWASGMSYQIKSPFDWEPFIVKLRSDGYVWADTVYIPYHAITLIQRQVNDGPGGNVVQLVRS